MIKLKDLLTEGKISSDVDRAARKLGIKFVKKTKHITTNKFSNPTGDMKQFGKDHERVKMDSWYTEGSVTKDNYKELGEKLIKMLKSKYKVVKVNKFTSGPIVTFIKDKKNPKSKFDISYAKTIAGPYIGYDGVHGE